MWNWANGALRPRVSFPLTDFPIDHFPFTRGLLPSPMHAPVDFYQSDGFPPGSVGYVQSIQRRRCSLNANVAIESVVRGHGRTHAEPSHSKPEPNPRFPFCFRRRRAGTHPTCPTRHLVCARLDRFGGGPLRDVAPPPAHSQLVASQRPPDLAVNDWTCGGRYPTTPATPEPRLVSYGSLQPAA